MKSIYVLKSFFLSSFFLAGHHHRDAPEGHIQSEYIFNKLLDLFNATLMLIC